jgi:hypothetical protein
VHCLCVDKRNKGIGPQIIIKNDDACFFPKNKQENDFFLLTKNEMDSTKVPINFINFKIYNTQPTNHQLDFPKLSENQQNLTANPFRWVLRQNADIQTTDGQNVAKMTKN